MSEPRLSKILIGILVVGILSVAFTTFLSSGSSHYAVEDYNDSKLSNFQSSAEEISNIIVTVDNQSDTLGGTTNQYDIFGGFLKSAWISLKTTGKSVDVMSEMVNDGVSELPMDAGFNIFLRNMLIAIFLTIFTIAIIFHFIRGSSRL